MTIMRNPWLAGAFCAALLNVVAGGAGTQARAQYSRRTPVVEAVQKTRASIVTVKVDKRGSYGRSRETTGSGVIVDERGYLVTNQHVVQDGYRIVITLADGTEIRAEVVAEESRCDLAILRVRTEKKLPALLLAPASDIMVGETVIAVGHPFGYRNTVSTGIISAVGRQITMPSEEVLSGLLQTDASINPGNSGGPLLNINGELIGINVALREGARGIAFAINADTVKHMLSKHLSALRVAGVSHGLGCREKVVAEGKDRQRVVVAAVAQGTPAADAGLKRGDEIRAVGKHAVTNRFDVERALWDRRPGEKVELNVVREGKTLKVALILGAGQRAESVARN
jgi:serine protease Do